MKTSNIFSLFLVFALFASLGLKTSETGYKVGDAAADFNLKNTDGKMVSLSQYKEAKGFIIVFTCNTCPYSVAYEDRIIELDKKYKSKGYPVIAINPNNPAKSKGDSYDEMVIRAKKKGFTFPYLIDEGQKVYPVYGAIKTPHVYLLNKENKALKVAYIGAIDNNYSDAAAVTERYVEKAVDALLNKKTIDPNTTKAIGCGIKK